ncbi:hypothetical protein Pcinc_015730 [Petrolisthes cinctipes]|uniref:Uncharacterized protein n=1 Tax=Petrolisthes cinctipes TaxID=88211 RepID=A0AAE1KPG1_PETCI|nr:hypothetical protein Pcinc_015730 [Petrolisthes cinctipes]
MRVFRQSHSGCQRVNLGALCTACVGVLKLSQDESIVDRLGQQRRARVMSHGGSCERGPVYCFTGGLQECPCVVRRGLEQGSKKLL